MMNNIILYFINPKYLIDEDILRKSRLLVLTCLITPCFSLFYLLTTVLLNLHIAFWAMLFNVVVFPIIPFLFKRGMSIVPCANIYSLTGYIGVFLCVYSTGGLHASVIPWFALLPIVSLMLSNKASGWFWTIISLSTVAFFGVLALVHYNVPDQVPPAFKDLFGISNLSGLVVLIFIITLVFENTKNIALKRLAEKNKIVAEERKRAEDLLLNILPSEVVEELKLTGKTTAKNFDLVTVLFADFINFTIITEEMPPEDLVSSIDEYFTMIDEVIGNYPIEKIKTVGDAYICASGLPVEKSDNPVVMMRAALDLVTGLKSLNLQRHAADKPVFEMRIGIHSGPVVAGVVGSKKFAYDIWGDTVNTAARMQQHGEAGKINISGNTRELVKHRFNCTHRGRLEAKHKGLVDMYFLDGRK